MEDRPPRPGGRYKIKEESMPGEERMTELTPTQIGEFHSVSGDKPKGKVYLMTFEWFGKHVGELEFKGEKLHFKGDADKSAKLLFDRLKDFVEQYIQERILSGQEKTKCQSTK